MDDYSDLPEWIRPGRRIAEINGGGVSTGTVERITKTQIVVSGTRGGESRYRRQPEAPNTHLGERAPKYLLRGSYFARLGSLDEPYVVKALRMNRLARAMQDIAGIVKTWEESGRSYYDKSKPDPPARTEEYGMELLDQIENRVRKIRAALMAAPGTAGQNDRAAEEM